MFATLVLILSKAMSNVIPNLNQTHQLTLIFVSIKITITIANYYYSYSNYHSSKYDIYLIKH